MTGLDLFVPGRLCLFGEHSDWAGEYRKTDPTVKTGLCLVAGTDQGIRGSAAPAATGFHISQILPDGSRGELHSYPSDPAVLESVAASGLFDSYAAGTASMVLKRHPGLGLRLEIVERTLPLKKGLSSSAAICVLTARAFSQVHSLGLSVEEEMEMAYRGELLTGSHCGRMDQACAFGVDPVLLTFDGDRMTTRRLEPGSPLHFLIVDLKGSKDTRRILDDLNAAFAGGDVRVREALGGENHRIVGMAAAALQAGDARTLGSLMKEAQEIFDNLVAPSCPSQLASPGLHEILRSEHALRLAWGGKGVGSQGDGTAQFICRGREEREELARVLDGSGLWCYPLTI